MIPIKSPSSQIRQSSRNFAFTRSSFYLGLLFFVLVLGRGWNAYSADVGLRFHHAHEVRDLLAEPLSAYPVCHEKLTVVQTPIEQYQKEAGEIRNRFPKAIISEEHIIAGPPEAMNEAKFDGLVKRIAAGERAGFEWGDLLVYREPLFAELVPNQNLQPGPWTDRRLISERDLEMLQARLQRAYAAGEIKQPKYRICGLLYSWLNIGEKEKAFIESKLDGVYVELNSRGGKWQVDGSKTTITEPFQNPGHNFVAFGLPGTRDTAQMAGWCAAKNKRFGITAGANVPDVWFRAMFDDYLVRCKEEGVAAANPLFTYLLHHNRGADDKGLPYFPESGKDTMTGLAKYLLECVDRK